MLAAGSEPPGYVDPLNGCICPLQVFIGSFHSFPLIIFPNKQVNIFYLKHQFSYHKCMYILCIVNLHVMSRRNALEENSGLRSINILINPLRPSGESYVESIKTVHVSYQWRPISYKIPPDITTTKTTIEEEKMIWLEHVLRQSQIRPYIIHECRRIYGTNPWDFTPLWTHQCQELNTRMSTSFQTSAPLSMVPRLSTRPTFSLEISTRYGVRYMYNVTPYSCF